MVKCNLSCLSKEELVFCWEVVSYRIGYISGYGDVNWVSIVGLVWRFFLGWGYVGFERLVILVFSFLVGFFINFVGFRN